ncbi:MAG TPA: hypothetical protein VGD79_12035 [Thermoanaerobaculia bacterium]|jgi:hypothetical protein
MTKDDARAWMARWRVVAEREREELRRETYEQRLRALATLMASGDLFDLASLEEEDAAVRERWGRIRARARRA